MASSPIEGSRATSVDPESGAGCFVPLEIDAVLNQIMIYASRLTCFESLISYILVIMKEKIETYLHKLQTKCI